ncbi:MAG: GNAT family N-acetyltransferase [Chloroflexi bacterium]|nr:MAG: GNAT family N-acetyltransferase [Chloroflexota bacterium]
MTRVTSSGRTPSVFNSARRRGGSSIPNISFCLSVSFGPAPVSTGDDDASLAAMASRNPGLCIVGSEDGRLVASALAGFDGRRGWLYHVATHPDVRRRGIATRLVRTIEDRLRAMGCRKLNLIVWEGEDDAMAFWTGIGYYREKTVEFAKELITK